MTSVSAHDKHEEGLRSFAEGRFEEAARWFEDALSDEESAELWSDWASAAAKCQRPADAERGYRKALALDPEHGQAAANLGAVLAAQGRSAEAIKFLEQSRTSIDEQEQAAVSQLLAQCRGVVASNEISLPPPGVKELSSRISRALSLQTTALNTIALRLIAIEEQLDTIKASRPVPTPAPTNHKQTEVIPKVPPGQILRDNEMIQLLAVDRPVDTNVLLIELCLLVYLERSINAKAAFELGTFNGRTTVNLAANVAQEGRVYTLDLPPSSPLRQVKYETGALYRWTELESRITQLYGDSWTFDFSPYFDSIDFVFIDAAHTFEHALRDTESALKLLRGGKGIIAWHDYGWEAVGRALNKLFFTNPRLAGMKHIEGTSLVYAVLE